MAIATTKSASAQDCKSINSLAASLAASHPTRLSCSPVVEKSLPKRSALKPMQMAKFRHFYSYHGILNKLFVLCGNAGITMIGNRFSELPIASLALQVWFRESRLKLVAMLYFYFLDAPVAHTSHTSTSRLNDLRDCSDHTSFHTSTTHWPSS